MHANTKITLHALPREAVRQPARQAARASLIALATLFISLPGLAQSSAQVQYQVGFSAPQTQHVEIEMTIADVPAGELVLHLPTWRPGKYQILDSASALTAVEASTESGSALGVRKTDKSTWRVDVAETGDVRIAYAVYANELNLRTRHVDTTHAFLSGSSIFLYSPAYRAEPLEVKFDLPEGWRLAGGLEQSDASTLTAPNYDVLVDSPIEAGLHDLYTYQQNGKTYEIVVWPRGVTVSEENLLEDFGEITSEHAQIFGREPFERYVFLVHASSGARGGTEHLNSTIMQTSVEALEGSDERTKPYRRLLGLTSHEFFHTWNVKQLRPDGIQPYDYQIENYSTLFWVAEGTTSYYAPLTLARRERIKVKDYLSDLGDSIDAVRRRPGSRVQSVANSSFDAWIKFNRPNPNDVNTTVSFYRRGSLVSLVLDAWVRRESDGANNLDGALRTLYERHPLASGGFTESDLRQVLAELSGADPADLFARYVHGTEPLPLEEAMATFGVELYMKPPKKDDEKDAEKEDDKEEAEDANETSEDPEVEPRAELGLVLSDRSGRTVVRSVLSDGPAYAAGLQPGDELVAIDGRRLSADDLEDRMKLYSPADVVEALVLRRDYIETFSVTLAERPQGKWSLKHMKDATDEQKANYKSWLEQDFPEEKEDDSDDATETEPEA